jgi:phage antirepressor YoqD-like protein
LAEMKIQFKQNETWVLYSEYADKGYTSIKQTVLDSGKIVYHRMWTGSGRQFINNLIKQNPWVSQIENIEKEDNADDRE